MKPLPCDVTKFSDFPTYASRNFKTWGSAQRQTPKSEWRSKYTRATRISLLRFVWQRTFFSLHQRGAPSVKSRKSEIWRNERFDKPGRFVRKKILDEKLHFLFERGRLSRLFLYAFIPGTGMDCFSRDLERISWKDNSKSEQLPSLVICMTYLEVSEVIWKFAFSFQDLRQSTVLGLTFHLTELGQNIFINLILWFKKDWSHLAKLVKINPTLFQQIPF